MNALYSLDELNPEWPTRSNHTCHAHQLLVQKLYIYMYRYRYMYIYIYILKKNAYMYTYMYIYTFTHISSSSVKRSPTTDRGVPQADPKLRPETRVGVL